MDLVDGNVWDISLVGWIIAHGGRQFGEMMMWPEIAIAAKTMITTTMLVVGPVEL